MEQICPVQFSIQAYVWICVHFPLYTLYHSWHFKSVANRSQFSVTYLRLFHFGYIPALSVVITSYSIHYTKLYDNAMQSRVLIDLIEKAVVKIREYPDNGGIYYSIIDLKFLNYFKYSEEDILEELDLERSTYYRKKKEATLLLGYILFGLIMPEYIRNEKVANMWH